MVLRPLRPVICLELGDRDCVTEQKVLQLVATRCVEQCRLLLRLDPLGNDPHVEAVGEQGRACNQSRRLAAGMRPDEKRFVDLDMAEAIGLQIMDAGEAGIEIIEDDRHAKGPEPVDCVVCAFGVGEQIAFGTLELEALGRKVRLREDRRDLFVKVGIVELCGRQVDGKRGPPDFPAR